MHINKSSTRSCARSQLKRTADGISLIEILVTLLVTSVGLLGIAALHLNSLRNTYDAGMRTHASVLAADIADRMRANRGTTTLPNYVVAIGTSYPTPTTQAQRDIAEWKALLTSRLPSGDGSVAFDAATARATITIQWAERGTGTITFTSLTEL
jgi:type IV pilus assembly protein PilV